MLILLKRQGLARTSDPNLCKLVVGIWDLIDSVMYTPPEFVLQRSRALRQNIRRDLPEEKARAS